PIARVVPFIQRFGWRELVAKPTRAAFAPWILRRLKPATFSVFGETFELFAHRHNTTWANERAVEIPIGLARIRSCKGRVLAIGNVLGNYAKRTWDVLDKYEQGDGVMDADATTWMPFEPYDLVVSVSTLEHIGFDEDDLDPTGVRILAAIENV